MSGLDKIISRLEQECEQECSEIATEAMARAHKILTDAEAAAACEYDEIIADAEKEAEIIKKKAESSAALAARRGMLNAKIKIIDDTLEAAVKKLKSLDTESYFSILAHLAKKYKQAGNGIMYLSENDKKRMPSNFTTLLDDIVINDEPADIEDGFILKYGDIEINCTLHAMLNAAREDLKSTAGEILFS